MPVQQPHVPVIIGGAKGKIYERIATVGDGWFAPVGDPAELGEVTWRTEVGVQEGRAQLLGDRDHAMWQPQTGLDTIASCAKTRRRARDDVRDPADTADAIKRLGDEVIAKL